MTTKMYSTIVFGVYVADNTSVPTDNQHCLSEPLPFWHVISSGGVYHAGSQSGRYLVQRENPAGTGSEVNYLRKGVAKS